jgi:subtilase family serine protease
MNFSVIRSFGSLAIFFAAAVFGWSAEPGRKDLRGHVPAEVSRLAAKANLAATNQLTLALGLPLRNEAELDVLLRELYEPGSTNYHRFLTPAEFAARFGATESDYLAVEDFARSNGLTIIHRHPNRLVLDVRGRAVDVERAFGVTLKTFRHPRENRDFFAPDIVPSVAATLPIFQVAGLDDFDPPRPHVSPRPLLNAVLPRAGSGAGGNYLGNDFRAAYLPGSPLTGNGQNVALVQYDAYYTNDIASYLATAGISSSATLTNVPVNGGVATPTANNIEVALDIEMVLSMAPGVSNVVVYEGPNGGTSWLTMLSTIANDTVNFARQIGCSWGATSPGGRDTASENIFKQMSAQGQSFFNASGDGDAFTNGVPFPSESTNITQVGGTTLSTSSAGGPWSSETAWNRNNGTGTSGGLSLNYGLPTWQQGLDLTAAHGSATRRNVPDVALTGESVFIYYNNGTPAAVGGTSAAAPLWAGLMALVNEQAVVQGQSAPGLINEAVYAIGKSSIYTNCFHDIVTGNNFKTGSTTNFPAVTGFDLCTGWGTPASTNLINAILAPPPTLTTQPGSRLATNGATFTLTGAATSPSAFGYFWRLNGTNLSAGGNVSGVATSSLTVTVATTNNSGNYQLIASNATGLAISTSAVVNVGFVPTFAAQPTNLALLTGSNAVFAVSVVGSTNLIYQWRKNGTNFAGAGISGTNTATLTLTGITTNSTANYTVIVTNLFGVATSSVAALTVVLPPGITSSSLTNRSLECGRNTNTFTIATNGTAPMFIRWSLDGLPVTGATNLSFSLTNLLSPNHTVSVTVTNLYASFTSNATLTVSDTLAPVITLNGAALLTNELGSSFTDLGATASDACAGTVAVTTNGGVNVNLVGTNTLTYRASDGNGNTNTATRTVIVRDTTPPTIITSFTNLVVAANANCGAFLTNATGTNFIFATDLSGALTITQSPTNNAPLTLGTNTIVLTVTDASGNQSFSTNRVIVLDQTPPLITSQPQGQTNFIGTSAAFNVAATACTPLAYQWLFNGTVLTNEIAASLTLTNLVAGNAGNYSVVVTASGGAATSAVAVLVVNLSATSLALTSSANPDGFKDELIFTATVTPTNAAGTIQFLTNGAAFDLQPLVAGMAVSTNLSTLPRGTNLIAAIYSGSGVYLSATNSFVQSVTNHLPVVMPAFYTLIAGLDLSITVADLATNWSDADGDALFITSIVTSTNGIALTNATPLFYSNPNYLDDQFAVAVSDGFGGTNFQTVSITVVPQTNFMPNIVNVINQSPGVTLKLTGSYGATYILEAADELISGTWEPVATNTLGLTGTWQFTDFGVTNNPVRFYRLKLAP